MYINSLRKAKEDLKNEQNEALVQAGEANAICELRQANYSTIKIEMVQQRSELESVRVEKNFLKDETAHLVTENAKLKSNSKELMEVILQHSRRFKELNQKLKGLHTKLDELKKAQDMYLIGVGVGVAARIAFYAYRT